MDDFKKEIIVTSILGLIACLMVYGVLSSCSTKILHNTIIGVDVEYKIVSGYATNVSFEKDPKTGREITLVSIDSQDSVLKFYQVHNIPIGKDVSICYHKAAQDIKYRSDVLTLDLWIHGIKVANRHKQIEKCISIYAKGIRYDGNIMEISFIDLRDNEEKVLRFYNDSMSRYIPFDEESEICYFMSKCDAWFDTGIYTLSGF